MTGKQEIQDTVARALCNVDPPCVQHVDEARVTVSVLVLAGYIQLGIEDLIEASSLGTPGAKALRASVSDEQAQKAIDRAREYEALSLRCQCYENPGDNSSCPVHLPYEPTPNFVLTADRDITEGAAAALRAALPPLTGGGAGDTPPAASAASLAPAAQAGQAIGSPAPPSPLPRRFALYRHEDPSGVSGTGWVAEGVQFTDGAVALRWPGQHPCTVPWDSIDRIIAVHGHGGLTEIVWLDGEPS